MKAQNLVLGGLVAALVVSLPMTAEAVRGVNLQWRAARAASGDVIESGLYGVWKKPVRMCFTSAEAWDREMAKMAEREELIVAGRIPPPPINWSTEAVILVALGEYRNYQYDLRVGELRRHGRRLMVDAAAAPGQPNSLMMTSPYALIVVERKGWESVQLRDGSEVQLVGDTNVLPHQAAMQAGNPLQGGVDAEQGESTTWGRVKSTYR